MIFSNSLVESKDDLVSSNDDSILKKDVQEEDFRIYSNPLFKFDDNFNSGNENPLFNEIEEDVENKNSKVFDEPLLPHTPFSDKVECFNPGDDIDEIDAFLAIEVSTNFEEGYYDSEGDVLFLESLLYDDTTHNPSPEVILDHETQNESNHETSITFSPRNDPLHHEFAGGIITNPSRIDSDPVQEEIDLFPGQDDLIPPGVENDDSEDEDNSTFFLENESFILDPSFLRPPPESLDVCLNFEPITAVKNNFGILNKDDCFNPGRSVSDVFSQNVEDDDSFTFVIRTFLPYFTYPKDSPLILFFGSEDFVFDPDIFAYSTDIAKITRKEPKTGQKRTRDEMSTQEPDGWVLGCDLLYVGGLWDVMIEVFEWVGVVGDGGEACDGSWGDGVVWYGYVCGEWGLGWWDWC
ncbi:hypothetical protein Tco_0499391 [Tanacetum coccineum]